MRMSNLHKAKRTSLIPAASVRLQCRMRDAPDTPDLQEDAAVLLVDGLGDQLPPLDLIQARCLVETTQHLRSALRCGIREGRCSNQIADVGALITGDEAFGDRDVHGAVCGAGRERKATE